MTVALFADLGFRRRGVLGGEILLQSLELPARLQRLLAREVACLLALLQSMVQRLDLAAVPQPATDPGRHPDEQPTEREDEPVLGIHGRRIVGAPRLNLSAFSGDAEFRAIEHMI